MIPEALRCSSLLFKIYCLNLFVYLFLAGRCTGDHGWLAIVRKQEIRSVGFTDEDTYSSTKTSNVWFYSNDWCGHQCIQWIHGKFEFILCSRSFTSRILGCTRLYSTALVCSRRLSCALKSCYVLPTALVSFCQFTSTFIYSFVLSSTDTHSSICILLKLMKSNEIRSSMAHMPLCWW